MAKIPGCLVFGKSLWIVNKFEEQSRQDPSQNGAANLALPVVERETLRDVPCKSDERTVDVTGSVDGSKVTWKYDVDFNGSNLTIVYTATLGETEKVAGEIEVQPMGVKGEFTAMPSKEAAKPAK